MPLFTSPAEVRDFVPASNVTLLDPDGVPVTAFPIPRIDGEAKGDLALRAVRSAEANGYVVTDYWAPSEHGCILSIAYEEGN